MTVEKFSVAMCVYLKDNPIWFDRALQSISVQQSKKPNEIVLVADGPIPDETEKIIEKYKVICSDNGIDFKTVRFPKNLGHGKARRAGVENTTNSIIAIMDSDDVSLPDRFEKQTELLSNEKIDIVGGNIAEFIENEDNIVSHRNVPKSHNEIVEFAKKRCPMNQCTVMFRKHCYEAAGGYIDWFRDEDYYLWLRMIKNGAIFANSGDVLVKFRVGNEMYMRRGGLKYFKSEIKLQKYMLKEKFIDFPTFFLNCFKRLIVQILLPNRMREWVFKKFARN